MSGKARVDWNRIREELLLGATARAISERYGIGAQTIRNKASREKWEVTGTKAAMVAQATSSEKVASIELALDEIGSRLRGSSIRARVKMAEAVEGLLKELEEDGEMGTLTKSRVLGALAGVAEKVHRWSSEPSAAELEGLKSAAVNLALIRTTPEQLRLAAKAKGLAGGREPKGRVEGKGVEASGK
jgi:hypothetical protein